MSKLYPLKFKPILKSKIWGGRNLQFHLNKEINKLPNCGESWELSAVEGNISIIENGFLRGNNLQEVIEVYMGDLVGDAIYEKFGIEFPLLIKFIDANDDLSIQVHPVDELSKERHSAYGKTEMWYILNSTPEGTLISGFNQEVDRSKYLEHLNNNTLIQILNKEKANQGDVFFIPAGRVHAICKGLVLAEIQQTSDVTYRIYDYNRKDENGNLRELHTELALEAIDFEKYNSYKTDYKQEINKSVNIADCQYFTTNILEFDADISKDYNTLDSFIIYICTDGEFVISYNEGEGSEPVKKGDTILLPAVIKDVKLLPKTKSKILEVFINN